MDPSALTRRNNLSFAGTGDDSLVFCHGFGTDGTIWRHVAPAFADRRRVLTLDLVGAGHSDHAAYRMEKYAHLDGYADDLLEICEAFGLRGGVYVGHSIGAMIGLHAAVREPRAFRALVMMGASARYLEDGDYHGGFTLGDVEDLLKGFDLNRAAWADQLSRAVTLNPDRPELAEEVSRRFQEADAAVVRHFARVTFTADCRSLLARCPVPVLLLQNRKDVIVPEAASEYLAAALPEARLVYLESEGHFAQLSDPGEVTAAIARFLEE